MRRALTFLAVTNEFSLMFARLYLSMLRRDGLLRPTRLPRTLMQVVRFFWGRGGVGWHGLRPGLAYLKPGFHPWNRNNRAKMERWLERNGDHLESVPEERREVRHTREPLKTSFSESRHQQYQWVARRTFLEKGVFRGSHKCCAQPRFIGLQTLTRR